MPNNLKSYNGREVKTSRKPRKAKIIAGENSESVIYLRSLKVSSLHIPSTSRYESRRKGRNVPFLRLTGRWLEEAGFPIDRQVDVIVENNLLIIKPAAINL